MFERPFWLARIEHAWRQAPIAWLCGVRRSGKTTLAQSLGQDRVLYVNCDLPKAEDMVRDPELFFRSCTKPVLVFDEIHQLRDPSRILKIGADLFPRLKILAIECKWDPRSFDSAALQVFRKYYPKGRNFVVTPSSDPGYAKTFGGLAVRVCTPTELRP
jgi:hypothetical protein